jgi:hypothetical protein
VSPKLLVVAGPTRLVSLPMVVAVATMLLAMTYSLLNPFLQSPDELAHADLVVALTQGDQWPDPGSQLIAGPLYAARSELGWEKYTYARRSGAAPVRSERLDLADLQGRDSDGDVNAATQHPPFYYVATAMVAGVVSPALFAVVDANVDRVVWVQRLVNVLALALAAWCTVAAVRELGGGRGAQLTAGAMLLAVPQLLYIGSSVNNDNGVVLAFAVALHSAAKVLVGDLSRRRAVVLGVAAAAAGLMKSFGLVAVVWVPVVYLARWRASGGRLGSVVPSGVVASGVAGVVGGSWWVLNVVRFGVAQPRVPERPEFTPLAGYDHGFVDWLRGYVPNVVQSFFGDFGYLDLPIAPWLAWAAAGAGLALIVVALARLVRGPRFERWTAVLVVPAALTTLGLGAYHYLVIIEQYGGRFAATQGRYMFGAVPATVALVGLAIGDRWRLLAPATFVAAVGMQMVGLVTLLHGFYAGATLPARLKSAATWSPWSPWLSLLVVLGALLAFAWLGLQVLRATQLGPTDPARHAQLDAA